MRLNRTAGLFVAAAVTIGGMNLGCGGGKEEAAKPRSPETEREHPAAEHGESVAAGVSSTSGAGAGVGTGSGTGTGVGTTDSDTGVAGTLPAGAENAGKSDAPKKPE